jgi:predicted dehydrogenase
MDYRRALIVGAGSMGRGWARTVANRQDLELVGWVDIDESALARSVEELGIEVGFTGTDLEGGIEASRPDFVIDVTTPESHCAVTRTALAAGLPVLGEKPMASSIEEARSMVAASEAAGKLYMVSQSRRYDPGLQAFRRLIEREIGQLGILNADFYIGAHFGGFRDEMPSPLVLDMAIHTFDAARYLSGADPVAVYAEEFNPDWSWYKGDACASAIFEMTGGLRFTYRGSWCSEGCHTSWDSDWRAVGPYGTATWRGEGSPSGEAVAHAAGFHSEFRAIEEPAGEILRGIQGSLDEFLRCLREGSTPMGECHDNIKSLSMVFGAIESARTGARVALGEFQG